MPNMKPGESPRTNYLRPNTQRELEYDAKQCKAQLSETSAHGQVQNKAAVAKRLRRIEKRLQDDAAPEVPAGERDDMQRRIVELEAEIKDGMLSHDEMTRNPPGAVGHNIRYQRKKTPAQLEWKSKQLRLNKDSDDPDVANIERLRPRTSHLSMDGAQIPGRTVSTPSSAFMANYDEIDFTKGPAAAALRAAVSAELAHLTENDLATPTGPTSAAKAPRKKRGKTGKRVWTNEQKQAASEAYYARQEAKQEAISSAEE